MRSEEIKVGQRVYDPNIEAHYVWIAGEFRHSDGELYDHLCSVCGFPDKFFLVYADEKEVADKASLFCPQCADIEPLQIVMVSVKEG